MSDRIEILCMVESIRYYKDNWGIIEVSVTKTISGMPEMDQYKCLILKGDMPKVQKDDEALYHVVADLVDDPKWGKQYNIVRMYAELVFDDNDKGSQKKYLAALYTPRIFNHMYETLDDPYQVLKDGDAKALVQVNGIGMATAINMINKFRANIAMGRIFTELAEYDLTQNMVRRLIDVYRSPDIVIQKVKDNPYVLADEVAGIGWIKADQIALRGGIVPDDPKRISAYMLKYLRDQANEGKSWITSDELLGAVLEALGDEMPDAKITEAVQLIKDDLWYNEDQTKIGLKYYYNIEKRVAEELIRLRDAEPGIKEDDWKDWLNVIHDLEKKQGWEFTEEQKNGIYLALSQNVVVITGMAGTGKSSLVTGILAVLNHHDYVQCALSGRAASRLSEITGKRGFTIHRLLGYPSMDANAKQKFTYHDENPLTHDIYILDELSMVNSSLFYYLLRAIPSGAKLICLGDHGQLEAIGEGNVAHDMIKSDEIATIVLSKIHRQAAESGIISEAFKIRKGQQIIEPEWVGTDVRGKLKDLKLTCYSDSTQTFAHIMSAYSVAMAEEDFDMMDTQILVPMKTRGPACTFQINNQIQEMINPKAKNKKETSIFVNGNVVILREGDKIINTTNNYKVDPIIYNGNIGQIRKIDETNEEITADFVGIGEVIIPKEGWRYLDLGYCITIHKSQGSQWKNVIVGLDFSGYTLLTRELCYTAITRAEKYCHLVAQSGALTMATRNESVSQKQTFLFDLLHEVAHPKLVF